MAADRLVRPPFVFPAGPLLLTPLCRLRQHLPLKGGEWRVGHGPGVLAAALEANRPRRALRLAGVTRGGDARSCCFLRPSSRPRASAEPGTIGTLSGCFVASASLCVFPGKRKRDPGPGRHGVCRLSCLSAAATALGSPIPDLRLRRRPGGRKRGRRAGGRGEGQCVMAADRLVRPPFVFLAGVFDAPPSPWRLPGQAQARPGTGEAGRLWCLSGVPSTGPRLADPGSPAAPPSGRTLGGAVRGRTRGEGGERRGCEVLPPSRRSSRSSAAQSREPLAPSAGVLSLQPPFVSSRASASATRDRGGTAFAACLA